MSETQTMPSGTHPVAEPLTRNIWAFAFLATALFGCAVYMLAAWGGAFVASLDGRLGEVVATEARAAREAGNTDRAISLFRTAIDTGFDDPRLRVLAMQDYARLTIEAGRYDEAISALNEARDADPSDGWNYNLLFDAYRKSGDTGKAMDTANAWLAMGEERGDAAAMRWAHYCRGILYRNDERFPEAFEEFLASHAALPNGDSAYQAALAGLKCGHQKDAKELAAWIRDNGKGDIVQKASDLLNRLTPQP